MYHIKKTMTMNQRREIDVACLLQRHRTSDNSETIMAQMCSNKLDTHFESTEKLHCWRSDQYKRQKYFILFSLGWIFPSVKRINGRPKRSWNRCFAARPEHLSGGAAHCGWTVWRRYVRLYYIILDIPLLVPQWRNCRITATVTDGS